MAVYDAYRLPHTPACLLGPWWPLTSPNAPYHDLHSPYSPYIQHCHVSSIAPRKQYCVMDAVYGLSMAVYDAYSLPHTPACLLGPWWPLTSPKAPYHDLHSPYRPYIQHCHVSSIPPRKQYCVVGVVYMPYMAVYDAKCLPHTPTCLLGLWWVLACPNPNKDMSTMILM